MLNRTKAIHISNEQPERHSILFASTVILVMTLLLGMQANGQEAAMKQLSRVDLAVAGVAEFTQNSNGSTPHDFSGLSTGVPYYGIQQSASTSTGGIATARYTKSKLEGGEFNFDMTVLTQSYNLTPALAQTANPFTVQANMQEYTWGYVAHGPTYKKLETFASVGFGTIKFKPTAHGGEGLQFQYRMAEYATAGVDDPIFTKNIGIRLQIRDVFYKAPDFGQSYLTSNAHTSTIEPTFGFYFKF